MAMYNTHRLLRWGVPIVTVCVVLFFIKVSIQEKSPAHPRSNVPSTMANNAAHDSAAESLDTLTAEVTSLKEDMATIVSANTELKKANQALTREENSATNASRLRDEQMTDKQKQSVNPLLQPLPPTTEESPDEGNDNATRPSLPRKVSTGVDPAVYGQYTFADSLEPLQPIPYYTIPANSTSVKDRLMTALVGRIPVKRVVTDPYPFKLVIADDNLAANGLRIPHLLQMIVSGYSEGDLNLVSVRGWVTSLTFVFDDGTISTTTSNENDLGHFTKANSLGYLSDKWGNPFIRGKLISNAPAYLAGNVALSAAASAANAYAAAQTTSTHSLLGGSDTAITGNTRGFLMGQAVSDSAKEAQQWWHDREEQSFDAIYVPPVDDKNQPVDIVVNFAKEIHIDYDPKGRKLQYATTHQTAQYRHLD